MHPPRSLIAAAAALALGALAAAPAPPFDVAYRAWDAVTEIARHNADKRISGECGTSFRPFVTPALRRQTKEQEEAASAACVEAARSACANPRLAKPVDIAKKCQEFR
jgi:hypothetical protein